jgi:hypothetical protein
MTTTTDTFTVVEGTGPGAAAEHAAAPGPGQHKLVDGEDTVLFNGNGSPASSPFHLTAGGRQVFPHLSGTPSTAPVCHLKTGVAGGHRPATRPATPSSCGELPSQVFRLSPWLVFRSLPYDPGLAC